MNRSDAIRMAKRIGHIQTKVGDVIRAVRPGEAPVAELARQVSELAEIVEIALLDEHTDTRPEDAATITFTMSSDELSRIVADAVAAEREACAQECARVCEKLPREFAGFGESATLQCAVAIRSRRPHARGAKPTTFYVKDDEASAHSHHALADDGGGFPRRDRVLAPAERAINEALHAVDAMPMDKRLIEACTLLGRVRKLVADYTEEANAKEPTE